MAAMLLVTQLSQDQIWQKPLGHKVQSAEDLQISFKGVTTISILGVDERAGKSSRVEDEESQGRLMPR